MKKLLTGLVVLSTITASSAFALDLDGITGGRRVRSGEIEKTTAALVFKVDGETSICTGSIISEDLILTAAHCLTGSTPVLLFGDNAFKPVKKVKGEAVAYPANYNDSVYGKNRMDVGLVRFKGGLPKGFHPTKLFNERTVLDGTKVVVAGYGVKSIRKGNGAGKLRKTKLRVADERYTQTEVMLEQVRRHGACPGDSGGPAYVKKNGDYLLWGVTNLVAGVGIKKCGTHSIYANINSIDVSFWLDLAARRLKAETCGVDGCPEAFRY